MALKYWTRKMVKIPVALPLALLLLAILGKKQQLNAVTNFNKAIVPRPASWAGQTFRRLILWR
jgi:hypothetical protein